ncbi:MAG: hypothetical protein H6624_01520 [Bdellovibrionaceae bacterium]|nr:hypothetical protein [Pseudobdellovibrionaceae bacterium]
MKVEIRWRSILVVILSIPYLAFIVSGCETARPLKLESDQPIEVSFMSGSGEVVQFLAEATAYVENHHYKALH